jgi:hypothetical protein
MAATLVIALATIAALDAADAPPLRAQVQEFPYPSRAACLAVAQDISGGQTIVIERRPDRRGATLRLIFCK